MTLREFFQRLPKDGWCLYRERYIRRVDIWDCPVCAATGDREFVINWFGAAEQMNLSPIVASRIADAADGYADTPTVGRIRRLLLKHCGLEEKIVG